MNNSEYDKHVAENIKRNEAKAQLFYETLHEQGKSTGAPRGELAVGLLLVRVIELEYIVGSLIESLATHSHPTKAEKKSA